MSAELLLALHAANAFEAMPVRTDLGDLHVPFDGLVDGSGGAGPWEGRLDSALRRGERVAVVGRSGEGKSSLIQFALGPTVEGLAPLPVAVGIELEGIVLHPSAFAAHFVRKVDTFVQRSMPQAGRMPSRTSSTSVALKRLPWLDDMLELTHELHSVGEEAAISAADHVETATRLLETIKQAGLRPVVLLDDTDKWTRTEHGDPDEELRRSFFGPILRLIAEDLGCAAVIAVHPEYRHDGTWRDATTTISTVIDLPRLPSSGAVASILAHREEIALRREPGESDGWASSGVAALFEHYGSGLQLRKLLDLARVSLTQAVDVGAGQVDADHVEWARRELEG